MSKVVKILIDNGPDELYFNCPGCDEEHKINTSWDFNNDFENPTIHPSIKVEGHRYHKESEYNSIFFVCHSFIKEGKIQFLNDCTHMLAGQTVELPEYE